MMVLVETNFVLELVFARDNFASCGELIEMANNASIDLLLPAYSMVEPNEAIIRRRKARGQAHDSFARELRELRRSTLFQQPASELMRLTELLIDVNEAEQQGLRSVLAQLLKSASVIDLNAPVLARALQLQDEIGMSPQDAVVLASVLFTVENRGGPACFITTNSKDFAATWIEDELARYDCKLLFDFKTGLDFIRSQLSTP